MTKCPECGYTNKGTPDNCYLCNGVLKESVIKELKKLNKVSNKRVILNELYANIRFLWLIQNPVCQFAGCKNKADDCHHRARRVGFADQWAQDNNIPLLIDYRFFMAVCRDHHLWIEDNQQHGIQEGYIVKIVR